jgi:hypothetical protein
MCNLYNLKASAHDHAAAFGAVEALGAALEKDYVAGPSGTCRHPSGGGSAATGHTMGLPHPKASATQLLMSATTAAPFVVRHWLTPNDAALSPSLAFRNGASILIR